MRFVDLHPRWLDSFDGSRRGVRIEFDCPQHMHRLSIYVANPLDGGSPKAPVGAPAWLVNGPDFETLTLQAPVGAHHSVFVHAHFHATIVDGHMQLDGIYCDRPDCVACRAR